MCIKTSIYFCFTLNFLACSQKPFRPIFDYNSSYPTNNIYNVYQFSKRQSHFPYTTIFNPAQYHRLSLYDTETPVYKDSKGLHYWNHYIIGSTNLGCITHIILHP